MSAQHTPGPWHIMASTNAALNHASVEVNDDTGLTVALVRLFVPKLQYEAEANARLIAAAPELLEALEEAAQWDSHDAEGVPAVWLKKALAAIAKARGQSGGWA